MQYGTFQTVAWLCQENELKTTYISDKTPILILGQLVLLVSIGDLQVRSSFLVADTLLVDILLGTELINQHILENFPNGLTVTPRSSRPIAISSSHLRTVNHTVAMDNFDTVQMTARHAEVKVAKQVRFEPRIATSVTVVSTARVLSRFEPNMALVHRQFLPANEITEVMPTIPFCLLLMSVFSQHVHVPRNVMMRDL